MTNTTVVPTPGAEKTTTYDDTWVVSVKDLVLPCFIGIFDHEKGRKQQVRISIKCYFSGFSQEGANLNYVCYNELINKIEAFVRQGHIDLVESLALGICDICFECPDIYRACVNVEKLAVYPNVTSVGVELERHRRESHA